MECCAMAAHFLPSSRFLHVEAANSFSTRSLASIVPSVCSSRIFSSRSTQLKAHGCFKPLRGVFGTKGYAQVCAAVACNTPPAGQEVKEKVAKRSVSVILLAGGKGTRMGANMPKQYLPLLGQPIALYSFYTFVDMVEVMEIVVVCDPSYRDVFEEAGKGISIPLKFAIPGKERQDSVHSGLQEVDKSAKLACVHDSARPLVLTKDIQQVMNDAATHGAAVLGVPVKATIKEAGSSLFVTKTLDRRLLWEMQTPQVDKPERTLYCSQMVLRDGNDKESARTQLIGCLCCLDCGGQVIEPRLLARGFELVQREGLEVTDDVSIVEQLKHPVFITQGSYTNLKVTTPDDLLVAERILHQTAPQEVISAVLEEEQHK